MSREPPTLEELETWPTPAQVIERLPQDWHPNHQRHELVNRLKSGTVQAVAFRRVFRGVVTPAEPVLSEYWKNFSYGAMDGSAEPFWQSASYTAYISTRGYSDTPMQFFGVRLRPEDISAMFKEMGIQASPTSPQGRLATALREHRGIARPLQPATSPAAGPHRPKSSANPKKPRNNSRNVPVTHAEFDSWYAALTDRDRLRGYRWVWAEAKRHFRPRDGVRKKWAEELSKDRGSGRKPRA